MLTGCGDQGQTSHIAPAILHHLEQLPVHTLDLPSLFAVSARSPEESCAQVVSVFQVVLTEFWFDENLG